MNLLIATFIYTGCCFFRTQWLAEFPEQVPGAASQLTAPPSFNSESRIRSLSTLHLPLAHSFSLLRIYLSGLLAFANETAPCRKHGEQLY